MQALLDTPEMSQSVKLVIASSSSAYGITRAKRHGGFSIETVPLELRHKERSAEAEQWILSRLKSYGITKVFLCGFMKILSTGFIEGVGKENIFNVHPSRLPLFKGAHGFKETLESGSLTGGVTVHKVVAEVDSGEYILQRGFEIPPSRNEAESRLWLSINEQRVIRESLRRILWV